jgi:hemerythrin
MAIAWSADLSVGVAEIDEQHKQFFKHAGNLLDACEQGSGVDYVVKMIDFLENYAIEHFETEERYMTEFGYPQLAHHRARHGIFRRNLLDLRARLQSDGPGKLLLKSTYALVMWFNDHVRSVDMAMGAFLKTKMQ